MSVICEGLGQPLVCVDIETTGMNYNDGRVIEIAAIRIENGQITDEFTTLINPETAIPYFITNLTGISDQDVALAPTFDDIAERLQEVFGGAVFVAHNVRFDYSFLRQEFRRLGIEFEPKQLCTVKLSRRLYPHHRSHKLASLISRYNFSYSARHRAYDDASVIWQFLQHVESEFSDEVLLSAIKDQLKHPSLPKHLNKSIVDNLPTGPGVYIFEDESGSPLYVGKSVNIRRRVLSHFTADKSNIREFKLAQSVYSISHRSTGGELEALLLESHLVKTLLPLHNRLLRRRRKLLVVKQNYEASGHISLETETLDSVEPEIFKDILAIYPNRSKLKSSLENQIKTFDLCPKLCGLEKVRSACFSHQLGRCKGACISLESAESYNRRLLTAFENKRIEAWPYDSAVIVTENTEHTGDARRGFIVDQWSIVGTISQEEDFEPEVTAYEASFDLDAYKILKAFITSKSPKVTITPYHQQAA